MQDLRVFCGGDLSVTPLPHALGRLYPSVPADVDSVQRAMCPCCCVGRFPEQQQLWPPGPLQWTLAPSDRRPSLSWF